MKILIISHAAPIAWKNSINRLYIASSFNSKGPLPNSCASMPHFDENIKMFGTRVIHDSFGDNRSDKIKKIIRYAKKTKLNPFLHVCWVTRNGDNCCKCEKCTRTILAIIANNYDPKLLGFRNYNDISDIIKTIREKNYMKISGDFYKSSIEDICFNYHYDRQTYIVDELMKLYKENYGPSIVKLNATLGRK